MVSDCELKRLDSYFSEASNIVIISHTNPDGDAVGSSVGCYHFLKARGKTANIVLPSPIADYLQFLNPVDNPIIIFNSNRERAEKLISEADLIVCLDFNQLKRTENVEASVTKSKAKRVLIDHHLNPATGEFDYVLSVIQTSSASELLFWSLFNMPEIRGDIFNMSIECANALYTGMMTDTNNFSNSTCPSTFEMASKLIERGVQKSNIQESVLHCYSFDRMRLMGLMLKNRMRYLPELHAAFMILTQKEKHNYNFQTGDSEGFVNLPLSIGDVVVSALFSESFADGKTYIKVSLRSKGDFDVNRLAREYFNGGGHKNASGGKLFIPIRRVPSYFTKSLKKYLKALEQEK